MRLYLTLKMNRPVKPVRDFVSPGGYNMTFGGWGIGFDFFDQSGDINEEDNSILTFEARGLDTDAFPDAQRIDNLDTLKTLEKINDFYIDTTYIPADGRLELTSIIAVKFETSTGETFDIPDDILAEYNERIANE